MIKNILIFILSITLFSLSSCSSDSSPTGSEGDTTNPTVSFENIQNGASVSGSLDISVKATDNGAVSKIALYIDNQKIGEFSGDNHNFTINCNDYSDGSHTLKAQAWDNTGNTGTTSINIQTIFDFAPNTDGKIKVSITHYKELDPVDLYGYGDPYFEYILKINGSEYDSFTSQVYDDTNELNTIISHTFNIPDKTREYQIIVRVFDEDGSVDDQLDYTPISGSAYIWTLAPIANDFNEIYNGEDDGSANFDDNDCTITLKVETIH